MSYNNLPVYEFKIDKTKKEDGVKLISIVDKPAMQSNFFMFAEEDKQKYNFVDEPKGMIAGLALIPNKMVYRKMEDGQEFYGYFTADTIEDIRNKFMKEKNGDAVNFQHVEKAIAENIYMVESYIVKSKNQQHDLKEIGIDAPIGSWFVQYKCEDLNTFKQIQEYGFQGFSVEAYLNQELVELNNQNKSNIMNKIIKKFKEVLAEMEATPGLVVDEETPQGPEASGDTKTVEIEIKPAEEDMACKTKEEMAKPEDMPMPKEKMPVEEMPVDVPVEDAVSGDTKPVEDLSEKFRVQLAEQQLTIESLNTKISMLEAQLKLPMTAPIINQKEKAKFSKEDLDKMTPYERSAIQKGFRIIK